MYHCKHYDQRSDRCADGTCLTCKNAQLQTSPTSGEAEIVCPHSNELGLDENKEVSNG